MHVDIDTKRLISWPAGMALDQRIQIFRKAPVISIVNRNLELYRGYHEFMRTLPGQIAWVEEMG